MVEPPTGTLTFLFTDIEGSTGRWEAQSAEMEVALARHDAVLRATIEGHGGFLFKHMGDGVLAAFASASAAVAAAIEAQRALELPVRMGLATGEATYRDGDYFGPTLNRAARVMAAGHGGQVLLANSTAALVHRFDLVDLGEHRLRDLSGAQHLFQLRAPGLREAFPALRTLTAVPGNLPTPVTSFIGRKEEMTRLVEVLRKQRLVTLTGVGGVGKTRLAIEVAADLAGEYEGGAWLVELAPVGEPAAMGHAIAATLSITPQPNVTMEESVVRALTGRNVLVVLDSCEHLIDTVAHLAGEVLRRCPDVTVLATSREALRVDGEQAWPVPSLRFHDGAGSAAVTLFAERAGAALPSFDLAVDAEAVVEICRRLDGIPLAIELAAARVRAMSAPQIRDRLGERLRLLTAGSRGAPERHQTLRHAVQWSFDLLTDPERAVLRRASVFAGGFSLEAAERVCGGDGVDSLDVLDLLDSLVRKSLVTTERAGDDVRYGLLETIRQFGEEQLAAAGEVDARRTVHARYFAATAAENWTRYWSPQQKEANEWHARELENLRAAFRWSSESGDIAAAAEIAIDSAMLGPSDWVFEPAEWAAETLAAARVARVPMLADLLAAAASAIWLGNVRDGIRFGEEAIDLVERGGFPTRTAAAWLYLGVGLAQSGQAERAVEVFRTGMARPEDARGYLCRMSATAHEARLGRHAEAAAMAEELVRLAEATGVPGTLALALEGRGEAHTFADELSQAVEDLEASVRLARQAGLRYQEFLAARDLAIALARAGDHQRAFAMFLHVLEAGLTAGEQSNTRLAVVHVAVALGDCGRREATATLSTSGGDWQVFPGFDEAVGMARAALGDSEFDRLAAKGAAMPFPELVRYAESELRVAIAEIEGSRSSSNE